MTVVIREGDGTKAGKRKAGEETHKKEDFQIKTGN